MPRNPQAMATARRRAAYDLDALMAERDRIERAIATARTRQEEIRLGEFWASAVTKLELAEAEHLAHDPRGRTDGTPGAGSGVAPPQDFALRSQVAPRVRSSRLPPPRPLGR